jgi:hypothetical protein
MTAREIETKINNFVKTKSMIEVTLNDGNNYRGKVFSSDNSGVYLSLGESCAMKYLMFGDIESVKVLEDEKV